MSKTDQNTIAWQSPSNIALVKYWGKKGAQIPMNPSLSFTLKNAYTTTSLKYSIYKEGEQLTYFFGGERNEAFEAKVNQFIEKITSEFPFLRDYKLVFESSNSFPHSAGIASSASSMSSIALCLCSMEKELTGNLQDKDEFFQKASFISRIGSGSACRSVFGGFNSWGETIAVEGSSDLYTSNLQLNLQKDFQELQDSILIVDRQPKKVSSTQGHGFMKDHPQREARIHQANRNQLELIDILESGNGIEQYSKSLECPYVSLAGRELC